MGTQDAEQRSADTGWWEMWHRLALETPQLYTTHPQSIIVV